MAVATLRQEVVGGPARNWRGKIFSDGQSIDSFYLYWTQFWFINENAIKKVFKIEIVYNR
jgi:hypothetical protein